MEHLCIQPADPPQGKPFTKRIAMGTVPYIIGIAFAARCIARMKTRRRGRTGIHGDVLRQKAVERRRHAFGRDLAFRVEGTAEHVGMHPRVGAAAPDDAGAHTRQRLDGILQRLLHRSCVRLHLPAVIRRAVIAQREQQPLHGVSLLFYIACGKKIFKTISAAR